ncbi:MAG: hypothetical protein R3C13_00855 [Hyphomonas sp.]|uniref:hypothetical protein n=1 Tax=Hyphomonas sp. TaxID=87 RepID=UPI003527E78D
MRIFVPILALALLAGCSSTKKIADTFDTRQNAGACPAAGSLYDAARIVQFDGAGDVYSDIAYTGEIIDVRTFCRYTGDNPLEAELELEFAFGKGPAATGPSHDFTYWVAVTRRSGKVLAKEHYTVRADFRNGALLDGKTEKLNRIRIPRADETIAGSNFEIVVGFDLTDDQLAFNREGKRFRMNAGQ